MSKGGLRPFPKETRSALDIGGKARHPGAIPGPYPYPGSCTSPVLSPEARPSSLFAKQKRGLLPLETECKGTIAAAVRNELKGSRHGGSNPHRAGVRGRRAPELRASAGCDHQLVRS
jgi:hypothetical protein